MDTRRVYSSQLLQSPFPPNLDLTGLKESMPGGRFKDLISEMMIDDTMNYDMYHRSLGCNEKEKYLPGLHHCPGVHLGA